MSRGLVQGHVVILYINVNLLLQVLSYDPVYNERGREFDFTFMYWGHVAMKIIRVDF